ncbi:hypothetical protein GCM10023091_32610 [Ravibacter arvi]|uniref:Uncharacterized protein n=1 Tax=Ravibacter arvi TaxID=2051041 RepID=A0ABP8M345_9BACT
MSTPAARALMFFLLTFCYWLAKGNQVGFAAEQSHIHLSQLADCHTELNDADKRKEPLSLLEFAIVGETEQVQVLKKQSLQEPSVPVAFSPEQFLAATSAAHSEIGGRSQAPHSPPVPFYILFRSIRVPHALA